MRAVKVRCVQNAGTTGATITGATLNTTASGTVTVRATVINGATINTNYVKDFPITVTEMPSGEPKQMTLTGSYTGRLGFYLAGTGPVTINWGNGKVETHTLMAYDEDTWYNIDGYQYSCPFDVSGAYTVTITAVNLTHFYCSGLGLTSLDVSENTALVWLDCQYNSGITTLNLSANTELTYLRCYGLKFTTLDLSANTKIVEVWAGSNNMQRQAIVDLFVSLHNNPAPEGTWKQIRVEPNPGISTLTANDVKIAEDKGWFVFWE